jgi:hypothetical protein
MGVAKAEMSFDWLGELYERETRSGPGGIIATGPTSWGGDAASRVLMILF